MKDSYKFFYLKKVSRTFVCSNFSLNQKNFSKNIENFSKKNFSLPRLKSNFENRKQKFFLKSGFFFPFCNANKICSRFLLKMKKFTNLKQPKHQKKNSFWNFCSLSFCCFFFVQRILFFSNHKNIHSFDIDLCLHTHFLKGCRKIDKKLSLPQKNQKILSTLLKKLQKTNFTPFFLHEPFGTFYLEKTKEKKFLFKKISFVFQKILHSQIFKVLEISSLYSFKNLKAFFEEVKFLPNCLFLEFFSSFFDQTNKNQWFTKLRGEKLQKSFLQKKRKIAKFFLFFFFSRKKIFAQNDTEKGNLIKGQNFYFDSFLQHKQSLQQLENKKFCNQPRSLKEIKKQKYLFCHFYLELQFSSFSVLKNFPLLSSKKKSLTGPFFSTQKKKGQKSQKKAKKTIKTKKIFFYGNFFKANFLLLKSKKAKKPEYKYFFNLSKRIQYKQKKDFFLLLKKRRVYKKIFILFFSSLNTFASFFQFLPTFYSFPNKNEKTKEKLKSESNNLFKLEKKEKSFFSNFEEFYNLKNKGNFTKMRMKNLFFHCLNILKKILQIFVDSFLNLNFLKTQNDSFDNLNTSLMIFHQYLKFNLFTFHGKLKRKKKIFLKNFSSFALFNENFFSVFKKSFSSFYGVDKTHFISLQKYSFGENSQYFLQQKQWKKLGFEEKFVSFYSVANLLHFEKNIFHLLPFLFVCETVHFSFLQKKQSLQQLLFFKKETKSCSFFFYPFFLQPSACNTGTKVGEKKDKKKSQSLRWKNKKCPENPFCYRRITASNISLLKTKNSFNKNSQTVPSAFQRVLKKPFEKQAFIKFKQKANKVSNKQKSYNTVTNFYKQNTFCFCKKFLKSFSLNPIFFIFQNYLSNFLFFKNCFVSFLKNKNCTKSLGTLFENCLNLKKHFFSNIQIKKAIQLKNKYFYWSSFPFEKWPLSQKPKFRKNLLKLPCFFMHFFSNPFKTRFNSVHTCSKKNSTDFLKKHKCQVVTFEQKISWLFSKKFLFLPTKLGAFKFFQFCPFFSTFLGMNSIHFLRKGQKKFIDFISQKRILSTFNIEPFSFSFIVQYKKGLQNSFFLSKKPTHKSIKLHLEFCKAVLKNAKGQNQLYFMQKLHKKIYNWCRKYKSIYTKEIFSYCDSILLKYLWNWAQRKHPKKSKIWIRNKYFHFIHSNQWFFGEKRGKKFFCLPLHSQKKIHCF